MIDFKYKTKWCVLTGAPAAGKTSVINELAKRGYKTSYESARAIMERELKCGFHIEDIRHDMQRMQRKFTELELAREMGFDMDELIFLDRAMPDSIAYFKLAGLDERDAQALSRLFRYDKIFLLERLPLVNDSIRTENDAMAEEIGKELEKAYAGLGYDIIKVPVLSVEERADFILKFIER